MASLIEAPECKTLARSKIVPVIKFKTAKCKTHRGKIEYNIAY